MLIGGVGGEGGVGFCEATAVALSGLAVAGAAAPSAPRSCLPVYKTFESTTAHFGRLAEAPASR